MPNSNCLGKVYINQLLVIIIIIIIVVVTCKCFQATK